MQNSLYYSNLCCIYKTEMLYYNLPYSLQFILFLTYIMKHLRANCILYSSLFEVLSTLMLNVIMLNVIYDKHHLC
jgi:hypothetical protein